MLKPVPPAVRQMMSTASIAFHSQALQPLGTSSIPICAPLKLNFLHPSRSRTRKCVSPPSCRPLCPPDSRPNAPPQSFPPHSIGRSQLTCICIHHTRLGTSPPISPDPFPPFWCLICTQGGASPKLLAQASKVSELMVCCSMYLVKLKHTKLESSLWFLAGGWEEGHKEKNRGWRMEREVWGSICDLLASSLCVEGCLKSKVEPETQLCTSYTPCSSRAAPLLPPQP